nr:uncharacterized protein LOC111425582 [Onthophagus taurus]
MTLHLTHEITANSHCSYYQMSLKTIIQKQILEHPCAPILINIFEHQYKIGDTYHADYLISTYGMTKSKYYSTFGGSRKCEAKRCQNVIRIIIELEGETLDHPVFKTYRLQLEVKINQIGYPNNHMVNVLFDPLLSNEFEPPTHTPMHNNCGEANE